MGLDMYLSGRKFYSEARGKRPTEDGFDIESKNLAIGYWRKHPDLHGFIVQQFADGNDNCQEIELDENALFKTMLAVRNRELPHTDGPFFGNSQNDDGQMMEDLAILQSAHDWLREKESGVWKSIIYQASW